ncbi:MAG TPA: CHC2 zinc finger domain-containing protein [Mycoplasmatales bacterium]|jgi:DNA primase|nr:CHC2 zinc finger domain-containing protein [Mycoplasmatales bacterium]
MLENLKIDKIMRILESELKINLERKGSNILFLCPFHNDKNPSLSLETNKKFFKCFGCQFKARDIYHFWSIYKGIDIEETIRELYSLGYINSMKFYDPEKEKNKKYFETLETFSDLYMNNLLSSNCNEALKYLTEVRKIPKSMIRFFNIGASLGNNQITEILKKNIDDEIAKSAIDLKLVSFKNNKNFDFFWKKQIILPIKDENGRVVSIASRSLENNAGNKYLFLPTNVLREKSSLIYNYYNVKISNEKFCYLVEGFFDVISMTLYGIKNCLSTLGSTVSDSQIETLKKLKKKIIIFFDGDQAGFEGSIFTSIKFIENDIDCEIIECKDKFDPDELCKNDKIKHLIDNAHNPIIFSIFYYYKKFELVENPQRNSQFIKLISKIFNKLSDDIKEFIIKKISEIVNLEYNKTKEIFNKVE